MPTLDREAPPRGPASFSRVPSLPWRTCFAAAVLLCCASVSAPVSHGQDLGEAARQDRARKEGRAKDSKHVYTDEDLKRPQILTPEDRLRFEAKHKNAEPLNAEKSSVAPGDPSQAAQPSLGDVARQYRRQKQAHRAQEAARLPYTMSTAPLASPVAPSKPIDPPPVVRVAPRTNIPPPTVKTLPRPANPKFIAVVVQRGDSLWKLAQHNLGQGSRWPELVSLNPLIVDPNHLVIGSRIYLPFEASAPRRPSRVQARKGDTLWTIARAHFGHGAAWHCIALANPQIEDADRIREGQELALPAACHP